MTDCLHIGCEPYDSCQMTASCWCCSRWNLTRPATDPGGCCATCSNRSPSACERAHSKETQEATPS